MAYLYIYRDLYSRNGIPLQIQRSLLQQWHTFTYTGIFTQATTYLYIYKDPYSSNDIPLHIQRSLLQQ